MNKLPCAMTTGPARILFLAVASIMLLGCRQAAVQTTGEGAQIPGSVSPAAATTNAPEPEPPKSKPLPLEPARKPAPLKTEVTAEGLRLDSWLHTLTMGLPPEARSGMAVNRVEGTGDGVTVERLKAAGDVVWKLRLDGDKVRRTGWKGNVKVSWVADDGRSLTVDVPIKLLAPVSLAILVPENWARLGGAEHTCRGTAPRGKIVRVMVRDPWSGDWFVAYPESVRSDSQTGQWEATIWIGDESFSHSWYRVRATCEGERVTVRVRRSR